MSGCQLDHDRHIGLDDVVDSDNQRVCPLRYRQFERPAEILGTPHVELIGFDTQRPGCFLNVVPFESADGIIRFGKAADPSDVLNHFG